MKRWVLRHERNCLRERESALQGWEGVELMTVLEWCVSRAKDLRFIGGEFHKRGEELRSDRSPPFPLFHGYFDINRLPSVINNASQSLNN